MKPETVVCFKWKPMEGYRCDFSPDTVNILRRSVARNYSHPHRFVCVTDDPAGLDPEVEVIPLWSDFARIQSPHGGKNPSCYRRLRLFSKQIATVLGPRFVALDLDTVVLDDVTPLWDRPEDFVIWGDTNPKTPYNGSMFLMTAGTRTQVWTEFDPQASPQQAKAAGFWGSDQGWISFILGRDEARWGTKDGVYSYRNHLLTTHGKLQPNARIVFFHGANKPWQSAVASRPGHQWIRDHYRL